MLGSEKIACEVVCFNQDKIHSIQTTLPQRGELESLAAIHKVLGHPVRLAILEVLKVEQCCVCDLANILNEPVSTISQHLKSLKTWICSRLERSGNSCFMKSIAVLWSGLFFKINT